MDTQIADRNPRFEIEESYSKVTFPNGQRRPYFYIVDANADYDIVARYIPDKTMAEKIAALFEEMYHTPITED